MGENVCEDPNNEKGIIMKQTIPHNKTLIIHVDYNVNNIGFLFTHTPDGGSIIKLWIKKKEEMSRNLLSFKEPQFEFKYYVHEIMIWEEKSPKLINV